MNRRPRTHRLNWRESASHAYRVVNDFECVVANYAGSPFAIAVDSCTAAIHLACSYLRVEEVEIPKFTYCGVAMSIVNSGGRIRFSDEQWIGSYQLKPYPLWDCARWFTSGMYRPGSLMCLSFHWAKHLPIGRGGAILCDDEEIVDWLRRSRFDGRRAGIAPKDDRDMVLGLHYYMTPPLAAQGLMLMASIAEHNEPLPEGEYPDLSQQPVFRGYTV